MSRPPHVSPGAGLIPRRLRTPRGTFAVLDAVPAGDPAGTVLLLPGFNGSKEDFIVMLAPLAAAGYRAVAVDGRGQHESPGPAHPRHYPLGTLAEDVRAQARTLADDGPVHLLGHSMGGLIARAAVLRGPDPFASLTLLSSGPGRLGPSSRWKVRVLRAGIPALGQRGMWRLWHPRPEHSEVGTFMFRRWMLSSPGQLRATGRLLLREPDRVEQLAATGLPVHVVSGERDGAWPVAWMDEMAARLRAHRSVIPGAEHSPNVERPRATAEALVDFWARLTPRR
ncbi:alpha/beta hydrolase [Streptomyces calidiresistens]